MPLRRLAATASALLALACAYHPAPARAASLEVAEIADVYARFSAATNARRWAPLLELFAPDATWEASAGALGFRHEGRPTIAAWLRGNEEKIQVLFYLAGPPRVELVTPELARAETSISELLLLKETGEVKQLFGVYEDELRKVEGHWVFAARRFQLRREEPLPP